jgi:hypothetical protein
MRGLLGFLITVQLIVGGVGAVTVDPDEEGLQTAAPSSTTSSTAAPGGPSTTAGRAAATTVPKAAATTTTAAPPTLKPTPSGKYNYRLQTTAEGKTETTKGTWAYFTAQETEGELRQLMLDTDDSDDGLIWTRVSQAWRADGLYLRSFREDASDGDKNECNFEPDLLLVPSPVVVGRKWTSTTACPGYDPPLRMEATSSVLRTDQVSVGGKKVAVYVIETRARVPVEGAEGRLHTVAYFNVDLGFNVREETTYSSDVPGSGTEKDVYELLSLTPEPMDKATTTTSTTTTTTTAP